MQTLPRTWHRSETQTLSASAERGLPRTEWLRGESAGYAVQRWTGTDRPGLSDCIDRVLRLRVSEQPGLSCFGRIITRLIYCLYALCLRTAQSKSVPKEGTWTIKRVY